MILKFRRDEVKGNQMYKLLVTGIFLFFFAIQNISALTLKKGETLGSDGQVSDSAASKNGNAGGSDETIIYLAWAILNTDKPVPTIEAVDRLVF